VDAFLSEFVESQKILPRTLDELNELMPTGFIAERRDDSGTIVVVGFAALEIYSRKLAEIRSLCVATELQGRGVGKQLTSACVELAREKNVFEVMVITSTEAFFQRIGFDFTLPGEKKALFMQTRDEA